MQLTDWANKQWTGPRLLNLKLREAAESEGERIVRQDWKAKLGALVEEIPVLQRLDRDKLEEALSHQTYLGTGYTNYDRLEFLGDKVCRY